MCSSPRERLPGELSSLHVFARITNRKLSMENMARSSELLDPENLVFFPDALVEKSIALALVPVIKEREWTGKEIRFSSHFFSGKNFCTSPLCEGSFNSLV